MAAKKMDYAQATDDILSRLDILSEYQALGVRFAAAQPRSSGMIECYAAARPDERKPSGAVQTKTGRYIDSASGENLSFFDFACKYGGHGFTDWRDARKFYADKAGVKLTAARPPEDPTELIEFLPWDDGHEKLARYWCVKHKRGASLEAVKLAGGRVGYLLYRDKKKKAEDGQPLLRRTNHKCICLPCYGEKLLAADPVAWVVYDISGDKFAIHRGEGRPPDLVKMKSVGPTSGTMMGLHGLTRLAAVAEAAASSASPAGPDEDVEANEELAGEGESAAAAEPAADDDDSAESLTPPAGPPQEQGQGPTQEITLVHKTGGPSDMLALLATILRESPELIDSHLVVTNASGEVGDVMPHQAAVFAGHKAVLWPDTDEPGQVGAAKWLVALIQAAREVWQAKLPWAITKKHGKDLRDFLNGVEIGEGDPGRESPDSPSPQA